MAHTITPFEMATQKLNELYEAITEVRAKKELIEEEEKKLGATFSAWHHIWENEKSKLPLAAVDEDALGLESLPMDTPAEPSPADLYGTLMPATNEASYGTRTAAVKRILEDVGSIGISPKNLLIALRARGVPVSKTFANSALFRLKNRAEVIQRADGRYVLAGLTLKGESQEPATSAGS
jgi:hypothetical protein